jgi:hypothetical protein
MSTGRTLETMRVIVGAPVYRRGAYVLGRFLSSQAAIQREDPSCELVLATNEVGLVDELEQLRERYGLRGKTIPYETVKPDYAQSRVWNIACGREAIRRYMLSQTDAEYYMSVDADMVYDPALTRIMAKEIEGYDIVFSGYPSRYGGIGLTGAGCMMVNRRALQKVVFRCVEFPNGQWMTEDNMFEMDSFRQGLSVKKGCFLAVSHYMGQHEVEHVAPQPVGACRRILTSALLRYALIRLSLVVRHNVPLTLWKTRSRVGARIRGRSSQYRKTPAD